jgi:NAD(P)-dependent dehydrogenase (short-subunit alcohol dehydrogenase family)
MRNFRRVAAVGGGGALLLGGGLVAFKQTNRSKLGEYQALPLRGRLAIVTGASSGIGKEVAAQLAGKGCDVILACRSVGRGEAACAEIRAAAGSSSVSAGSGAGGRLEVRQLDVSSRASIDAFATGLAGRGPIHVLVHNAGDLNHTERRSTDGVELTLATNYLGPLLITQRLLQQLEQGCNSDGGGRRSRVVLVGSRLEKMANAPLRLDLLEAQGQTRAAADAVEEGNSAAAAAARRYDPLGSYSDSKLCLMLWSRTLGGLTKPEAGGPLVVAVTPGMVHTGLFDDYPARATALRSAGEAATGVVYCADAARLEEPAEIAKHSGGGLVPYLYDGVEIECSEQAADLALSEALCVATSRLLAFAPADTSS